MPIRTNRQLRHPLRRRNDESRMAFSAPIRYLRGVVSAPSRLEFRPSTLHDIMDFRLPSLLSDFRRATLPSGSPPGGHQSSRLAGGAWPFLVIALVADPARLFGLVALRGGDGRGHRRELRPGDRDQGGDPRRFRLGTPADSPPCGGGSTGPDRRPDDRPLPGLRRGEADDPRPDRRAGRGRVAIRGGRDGSSGVGDGPPSAVLGLLLVVALARARRWRSSAWRPGSSGGGRGTSRPGSSSGSAS